MCSAAVMIATLEIYASYVLPAYLPTYLLIYLYLPMPTFTLTAVFQVSLR